VAGADHTHVKDADKEDAHERMIMDFYNDNGTCVFIFIWLEFDVDATAILLVTFFVFPATLCLYRY
jgi:hypothetical protein